MRPRIDIGVTGSQRGMTEKQRLNVMEALTKYDTENYDILLHHGCCIGADEEFVLIAKFLKMFIVAHIPENRSKLSDEAFHLSDYIRPQAPYLERNRNIVDKSSLLLATPSTSFNVIRSGTWYTIRYAKATNRPVTIFTPDGEIA